MYALTHVCKRKQKLSVELDKENVRENFSLNHSVLVLGPSAQPSFKEGALWLQKQLYEKSRGAIRDGDIRLPLDAGCSVGPLV